MSKIKIRGIEHNYQYIQKYSYQSSQPVLVFIHGWMLSQHFWHPLMELLQHNYPCLAYDLKGFGESRLSSQWTEDHDHLISFSLEDYTYDLQELLHKLNIEKAWLIGHSLGGSVALWGADICNEIVKGVICVNAGGGIYIEDEFNRFRQAGENIVKFRASWLSYLPFLDLAFARMMVKQPLNKKWGKQRLKDFLIADGQSAIASLLESTKKEQVHYLPQIVSRLKQPVHFIAGKEDLVMESKYVRHLASFHSLFAQNQKNVHEINNCGHFAMLEQTKIVYERMVQILEEH